MKQEIKQKLNKFFKAYKEFMEENDLTTEELPFKDFMTLLYFLPENIN